MSDEMVNVKKSDLEFVRAYTNALEGMKELLTRERDEARAESAAKSARIATLEKQLAALPAPVDVEAFVREVEEATTVPLSVGEGNQVIYEHIPRLIAVVRAQTATIRTLKDEPDGENLYDGCLCGEISPSDKPCLTCFSRLGNYEKQSRELLRLRERLARLEAKDATLDVDGKTPGQVLRNRYAMFFGADLSYAEALAQAVLAAFGPQIAAKALQSLRDSLTLEDDPSGYFRGKVDASIASFTDPKKPTKPTISVVVTGDVGAESLEKLQAYIRAEIPGGAS